ncbi:MAG TPA: hypothetical protein VJ917_10070 [Saprospiraceae bacterium]|nr:hypothetical protein [Saprospiraceae bacterium]
MKYKLFFVVAAAGLFITCQSEPQKLTPRMMKEVDQEFRKAKQGLKEEMDSLCLIYREEHQASAVDSLVELRLLQDKEKRIYIDD